jgi:hypothetical protein
MHSSNFFGLCWYSYRCLTQISLDQVGEATMLISIKFLGQCYYQQQMHIVQTLLVILLVIAINANNQISLVHAGFKHLMFGIYFHRVLVIKQQMLIIQISGFQAGQKLRN